MDDNVCRADVVIRVITKRINVYESISADVRRIRGENRADAFASALIHLLNFFFPPPFRPSLGENRERNTKK